MWCAHWCMDQAQCRVRAGGCPNIGAWQAAAHLGRPLAVPAPWITWRRLGNTDSLSRTSPRCSHPGEIWTIALLLSMWWVLVLVVWWRMISGLLAMYKIIITQPRVTPQLIGETTERWSHTLHCRHWRKRSSFGCCNNMQHCNRQYSLLDKYLSIANSGYKSSG